MNDPVIHAETDEWALVVKPHGMPTAPVSDGEEGTLLAWFLNRYPRAAEVSGEVAAKSEQALDHAADATTAAVDNAKSTVDEAAADASAATAKAAQKVADHAHDAADKARAKADEAKK